jgi:hypothetical protein
MTFRSTAVAIRNALPVCIRMATFAQSAFESLKEAIFPALEKEEQN